MIIQKVTFNPLVLNSLKIDANLYKVPTIQEMLETCHYIFPAWNMVWFVLKQD